MNDPPDSKAQMKDMIAQRLYKAMITQFYKFSTMIIPPDGSNWPAYECALIILDGYYLNPPDGGHHKKGKERRKQPLIKFIVGNDKLGHILFNKIQLFKRILNLLGLCFKSFILVIAVVKHKKRGTQERGRCRCVLPLHC